MTSISWIYNQYITLIINFAPHLKNDDSNQTRQHNFFPFLVFLDNGWCWSLHSWVQGSRASTHGERMWWASSCEQVRHMSHECLGYLWILGLMGPVQSGTRWQVHWCSKCLAAPGHPITSAKITWHTLDARCPSATCRVAWRHVTPFGWPFLWPRPQCCRELSKTWPLPHDGTASLAFFSNVYRPWIHMIYQW